MAYIWPIYRPLNSRLALLNCQPVPRAGGFVARFAWKPPSERQIERSGVQDAVRGHRPRTARNLADKSTFPASRVFRGGSGLSEESKSQDGAVSKALAEEAFA